MGQHDIGDYLKKRVSGHQSKVDTDAVWDKLDLNKKKKRRGFFWVFGIGILLIGFTGLYFIETTGEQKLNDVNSITTQTLANDIIVNNSVSESTASKDEFSATLSESMLDEPAIKRQEISLTNKHQNFQSRAMPQVVIKSNNQSHSKTLANNPINKISKLHSSEKSSEPSSTNLETLESLPILDPLMTINMSLPLIKTLRSTNSNLPKRNFLIRIADQLLPSPKIKDQITFSLNSYVGIYYVDRKFKLIQNSLNTYVSARDSTETPLEAIVAGTQFCLNHKSGMWVGLGIEYQRINEVFRTKSSSTTTEPILSSFVFSKKENTTTEKWTHYNKHELYNIPLSIGYRIDLKNWTLRVSHTSLFSFKNAFSGKHLIASSGVDNISSDFYNRINFSSRIEANIQRQLAQQFRLELSPSFMIHHNSFIVPDSGYEQKYKLLGLRAALLYQI